ncbi:hypothetical protein [Nostoc sp. CCY 9925]|uniref:hypothetical protein n=1 Tax=Nostoc sp. CCY 9925 TaxID=3103865 RepID=UPI0039C5AC9E
MSAASRREVLGIGGDEGDEEAGGAEEKISHSCTNAMNRVSTPNSALAMTNN